MVNISQEKQHPLTAALSGLGDLIVLNALFLLTSIPVVTIGASLTAASKTAHALSLRSCSGVTRTFFSGFRDSFRQATAVWLCALPWFAAWGVYYVLSPTDGSMAMKNRMVAVSAVCLCICAVLCYIFPLIGRYQNRTKEHLKNAAILSVIKFPRTLLLTALSIFPVALFLGLPSLFFYLLPCWLLIGFAGLIRAAAGILVLVFHTLDALAPNQAENSL